MSKNHEILVQVRETAIDHAATGARAKAYREARRITLREVAALLSTPQGKKMSVANLNNYEAGIQCWTPELAASYQKAVDKINKSIPA